MATIKSYTDIEQSKKLAEILPLESGDMYYWCADHYPKEDWIIEVGTPDDNYECICAWSLAALFVILPSGYVIVKNYHSFYYVESRDHKESTNIFNNPVDACYEMILKLHKLKML